MCMKLKLVESYYDDKNRLQSIVMAVKPIDSPEHFTLFIHAKKLRKAVVRKGFKKTINRSIREGVCPDPECRNVIEGQEILIIPSLTYQSKGKEEGLVAINPKTEIIFAIRRSLVDLDP